MERFSLCRRGDELLVFVEMEGEIQEVKETPVFQRALVAFLREQGVQYLPGHSSQVLGLGQDLVSATVAVGFSEEPTTAR